MSEKKNNKTVRLNYHLKQLIPLGTYIAVLILLFVFKIWFSGYQPLTSKTTVIDSRRNLDGMKLTMHNLNNEKRNLSSERNNLEENIDFIKKKREREGSLRFYTTNIPAYARYVEFRANATGVEIIDVDVVSSENKVNYTLLGGYNEILALMDAMETREIYYVENFELLPSFSNKGSYVKFTANFNLEDSIVSRYEKKVQFLDKKETNVITESNILTDHSESTQLGGDSDEPVSD